MIKNTRKTSRIMSLLSAIIAVAMLGTTVFASDVLSDMTAADYEIKIFCNSEEMNLNNKPFFYENTVYVPLREFIGKLCCSNDSEHIVWDNGKITIYIDDYTDYYMLNIGSREINIDAVVPAINSMATYVDRNAPVIMNDITYVPFEYINFFNRNKNGLELYYQMGNLDSKSAYKKMLRN